MSSKQESNLGPLVDTIVDSAIITAVFEGVAQSYNIYDIIYNGLRLSQDQIMNYSLLVFGSSLVSGYLYKKIFN